MTIHSDCGKEIRWAQRDDDPDRFRPPLEFAGQAYIVTEDNIAVYVTTYKQHECDPDDIKRWMELKRAQAEALGKPVDELDRKEERNIARKQAQNDAWSLTIKIPCATCGAKAGQKCFNMTKRKQDIVEENKWPHHIRALAAWSEENVAT